MGIRGKVYSEDEAKARAKESNRLAQARYRLRVSEAKRGYRPRVNEAAPINDISWEPRILMHGPNYDTPTSILYV
jgi:hypothetical protein